MHTHNETIVRAGMEACLEAAVRVERWPEILPHYREVRFLRREGEGRGLVRMAAYRHFGPFPWPARWESRMWTDFEAGEVHYRHVAGITRAMEVVWSLTPLETEEDTGMDAGAGVPGSPKGTTPGASRTRIVILHDWEGPPWPLIGGFAARHVIGPHFIRVIADRTLAGIRRWIEGRVHPQKGSEGG